MVTILLFTHDQNCDHSNWFWRFKEHPFTPNPDLELWRTLKIPDWGLASWSGFGYGHWSLMHPCYEFCISILNLKVQRTSMSFKSWLGVWRMIEVFDWGLASWSWFAIAYAGQTQATIYKIEDIIQGEGGGMCIPLYDQPVKNITFGRATK